MFKPPEVHLPPHKLATRASDTKRAMPLGEANMPRLVATARAARSAELFAILDWLDVEKSPRYKRTKTSTWCNIYATDVCYLAGYYLPHTFWTPKALTDLEAGKVVAPKYGSTITELSANSLYEWLVKWGPTYGWIRAASVLQAQQAVNAGGLGVVCAKKPGGIGHITVVAPESSKQFALMGPTGVVAVPVQSQAGAKNYKLFAKELGEWWDRPGYVGGIWIQEYKPVCPTCSGSGINPT